MTRWHMDRAYVRLNLLDGSRAWVPIGWYCRQCRGVTPTGKLSNELLRREAATLREIDRRGA